MTEEGFDRAGYLVFRVQGSLYALPLANLRGVDRVSHITAIPGCAAWVAGMIYFRGGMEAAVDLSCLLSGTACQLTQNSRVILLESDGVRSALICDEILEIRDIDSALAVGEDSLQSEVIRGSFDFSGQPASVMEPVALVKKLMDNR